MSRPRHPQMQLELVLTDRHVDLAEEKFDLAFRSGTLKDTSVVAHELGRGQLRCFASREYLRERGTPLTPRDLRRHECIVFAPFAPRGGAGRSVRAAVPWRSRCAHGSSSTACRSRSRPQREGSALPVFREQPPSKASRPISSSRCSMRMCRLRGLYAVHASGGRVSPVARAFLEVAKKHLERLGWQARATRV